jgi:superfamily II DNA or RNA helicase
MTRPETGCAVAFQHTDPAAAVLRMLSLRFGTRHPAECDPDLALFQQHAIERIRSIIAVRRGALLCDSVGLGKTHVARSLIRTATTDSRPVLVCAPAQLAQHWRRYLRGVPGWSWLSHTALSRGRTWHAQRGNALIVVDEAHAFRNPDTRRYHALALMCADADVLLMTATPVNNTLADFHAIVRLFARNDCFADVGVPDLDIATDRAIRSGDTRMIRRVAEAVVVRRTRDFVQRRYGTTLHDANGRTLRFPAATPVELVHYNLDAVYPGLVSALGDALLRLTFPVHAMSGTAVAAELMRLALLKRLESSTTALRSSLRRQVSMLQQFIAAAHRGFLVDAREHRTLFREVDGAVQLALDGVALRPWPRHVPREEAIRRAQHDLLLLRDLLLRIDAPGTDAPAGAGRASCTPVTGMVATDRGATDRAVSDHVTTDDKVRRLHELLAQPTIRSQPVLIFTEYRDTAVMLWRTLSPAGGVALIHGQEARLGTARTSRNRVVERFAPHANGLRPPQPRERVHILIATDVLAEGLNLQDARTVVSYDVPWNPVRLAQRIGRIDRLGSPHAAIRACVFQPDRQLDALLGLVRRVRQKLRAIRVVGGDAPRLVRSDALRPVRDGVSGCNPDAHSHGDDACSPRRPTSRLLHGNDRRWDVAETLRLEYEERCREGPPDRHAGAAEVEPLSVPAGAMHWSRSAHGTICCVTTGATAWLVLLRPGRAPIVGTEAIDRLLLDALTAAPATFPDAATLAFAGQQACRVVHRRANRQHEAATPSAPEVRRAAITVHRWLASRPGGATPDETATADRLLRGIAATSGTADRRRLADVARTAGSVPQAMQRLLSLYSDPAASARTARMAVPAEPPRLRAVLALLSAPSAHP